MRHDVIVIGAGIAGLQCARRLGQMGRDVLVLERAQAVGGRCATSVIEEQLVDYGPFFVHGHEPAFLAAVEAVPSSTRLDGWPNRVHGSGRPCQPDAFAPFERRTAWREGLTVFAQHVGQGVPVRFNTLVTTIAVSPDGFDVVSEQGEHFSARDLVLAMALEQSLPLVRMLPAGNPRDAALGLLDLFASVPSLTLAAGYPPDVAAPPWDMGYPEDEDGLMLVSHESAKRPGSRFVTLVYQATPRWSRQQMDQPQSQWQAALLARAAAFVGEWAGRPVWTHPHLWRYARVDRGNELTRPLLIPCASGRVGLAGDIFAPGGGVQAAWLSGGMLAELLGAKE
jgi:renalase